MPTSTSLNTDFKHSLEQRESVRLGLRPDVQGYADKLEGDDCDVLKLRPGITGPATLKYRLEDEQIAAFVAKVRNLNDNGSRYENENEDANANSNSDENLGFALPENVKEMSDQELAVWYNDNVIYPDKVRLNCYYYRHYSFWKDIEMIFATVLGSKISFAGERF